MSSPEDIGHSPSIPHAQEQPLSVPGTVEPLLSCEGCKKLSKAPERTLPVQSSLSSIQASGIWGQYQHSHHTLEHLPPVKKDVVSSQSAPGFIGAFLSPVVPVEDSTPTQKVTESFLSGQGYL